MMTTTPTRRAPRWRRRLLRAALCLLLGAVTTVGVAWWIALRWEAAELDASVDWLDGFQDDELAVWRLPVPTEWFIVSPFAHVETRRHFGADHRYARWHFDNGWAGGHFFQRELRLGLPLRAMELWRSDEYHSTSSGMLHPVKTDWRGWSGGLHFGRQPQRALLNEMPRQRFLPLYPVWPGFLMNTILYAAAWWWLLAAPGVVRRWSRWRRNLCVACGYDLRGLGDAEKGTVVCPECGA